MNKLNFNAYQLKWLALITMTIDHFGVIVLDPYTNQPAISTLYLFARLIGRIAFPLFAFMIAEGVFRSRNRYIYVLRLFFMAFLIGTSMVILEDFNIQTLSGNIFIDLSMGALAMIFLKEKNWFLKPLALVPILYVFLTSTDRSFPNYLRADYGIYGLVMMMVFFLAYTPLGNISWLTNRMSDSSEHKDNTKRYLFASTALIFMHILWYIMEIVINDVLVIDSDVGAYLSRFVGAQTYAVFAGYFIYRYRGEKGPSPRWFQTFSYLYYPLHFVVLYVVFYLTTI
jgi:hypothetical protein